MSEQVQARGPGTRANDIVAIRRNIASRLSYIQLYEAIQRGLVERDALPIMEELINEEREVLSRLAAELRRLNEPVDVEEGDEKLIAQLRARRGTLDRLEFVTRGAAMAAQWYEDRAADESLSSHMRELFSELGRWQRERVQRLEELMRQLGG